jgi:hypothetical protein
VIESNFTIAKAIHAMPKRPRETQSLSWSCWFSAPSLLFFDVS